MNKVIIKIPEGWSVKRHKEFCVLQNKFELPLKVIENLEKIEADFRLDKIGDLPVVIKYVSEKFGASIEFMATSNLKLKERIYLVYRDDLIRVLWNFNYKNLLPECAWQDWEFLQEELPYRISPTLFKKLKYYPIQSHKGLILADCSSYDKYKILPSYISTMRTKSIEIAKAIFRLYLVVDELAGKKNEQ